MITEQRSALKTESDEVMTQCTHIDYVNKVLMLTMTDTFRCQHISVISCPLLSRIAITTACYRPSSVICRSVSLLVSRSGTLVSPAKTAEAIDMSFGLRTQMGPRNHIFDGGEPIALPFGLWSPMHAWAEGSTSSIVFARWRQCAQRHSAVSCATRVQELLR